MACGGGITTGTCKVNVPACDQGRPTPTKFGLRLEERSCDIQLRVGDEIGIAQQDWIIMLDTNGSLKEDGFATL